MKVRAICKLTGKENFINLPVSKNELLKFQGNLMNRNTLGYILGAEVDYYDDTNNKIDNIFEFNKNQY